MTVIVRRSDPALKTPHARPTTLASATRLPIPGPLFPVSIQLRALAPTVLAR